MILLPSILESVTDRKDRSCVLKFGTRELSGDEFNILRDLRDQEGFLAFAMNPIQASDIPDQPAEAGQKTPSQRLRAVLFILWKQSPSGVDFETFYRARMESLIEQIKNRLT